MPEKKAEEYYKREDRIPQNYLLPRLPDDEETAQGIENDFDNDEETVEIKRKTPHEDIPAYISHPTATPAWFVEDKD